MTDAAEKINELRRIEQEIAEHRSAISSLERRRLEVLEMRTSRLDPKKQLPRGRRRELMEQICPS